MELILEGIPDDLGPYEPDRLIHTGRRAEVWAAKGPHGDVILKVARGEADRAHVLRESQWLDLCQHDNLVRKVDQDPEGRWLALAPVTGRPLVDWAKGKPVEEIVQVVLDLLPAIAVLHKHDLVHGDLKPNNVLVDDDDKPTLLDLGTAAKIDTPRDGFHGTLGFAAPELLRNARPSAKVDAYGIGALLYSALTGRPPLIAADPAALTYLPLVTLPPPPSSHRGDIPALLNNLVLTLLARDPGRRPATVEAITGLLEKARVSPPGRPVLGMHEEREELRRAVVGAADHEARVVVVFGPPGSGRRTLIGEAVEAARREGLSYVKGVDPKTTKAASLKKGGAPSVLVLRGGTPGLPRFASEILDEFIPSLLLIHSERPIPSLARKGAIHVTPVPLRVKDAIRMAKHLGGDTTEAETWWRQSQGLPAAIVAHIRAWKRAHGGTLLAEDAELPPTARAILESLQGSGAVPIAFLAESLRLGQHALLDHCEVLFAEGLITYEEDGAVLREVRA